MHRAAHLEVTQSELAGGFLVELQGDLKLVQLLAQARKLLEVSVRYLHPAENDS